MVGWDLGSNFLLTYDQKTGMDAKTSTPIDLARLQFSETVPIV